MSDPGSAEGAVGAGTRRLLARRVEEGRLDWVSLRLKLPEAALGAAAGTSLLVTGLSSAERVALAALAPPALLVPGRVDEGAWLGGTREQLEALAQRCLGDRVLRDLARVLGRALHPVAPPPLTLAGREFRWGQRTHVMGIVNVTPDSFSDGGRFHGLDLAVAHGEALAAAGADLLDVGGETTKPGSEPVSVEEELARVVPVVEGLRARTGVPISVDTTKAEVARAALAAGASLINDVSGLTFDPRLAGVIAEAGAACCVMHLQGVPRDMQRAPHYEDVVAEVLWSLDEALGRATGAGIPRERVLVDPGIGFGKTLGHNLFLLRRLADLRQLGAAVLVGTSRKAFLGRLAGGKPVTERMPATLGSVAAMAVMGGADVVRVHDVAECRDAAAVADAIAQAIDGGVAFDHGA